MKIVKDNYVMTSTTNNKLKKIRDYYKFSSKNDTINFIIDRVYKIIKGEKK